jgi:protein gp37
VKRIKLSDRLTRSDTFRFFEVWNTARQKAEGRRQKAEKDDSMPSDLGFPTSDF